jgi:NO-binding membrane sensor protein with MHYT domain
MFQLPGLCIGDQGGAHFMHDLWIVVLSYIVAVIGSFVAIDMTERLNRARGRAGDLWLLGSATVLGGSIWSMHFIGMLAAYPLLFIACPGFVGGCRIND